MTQYLNLLTICFLLFGCNSTRISEKDNNYKSENLVIQKIANDVYQHISFLNSESFGKVSCNGMIVLNGKEAIIFDTPPDNNTTSELINWVQKNLDCKIKAVIPTHFHEDCLGGLSEFHKRGIPSYANDLTLTLAKSNNLTIPQNGFSNLLQLKVGNKEVIAQFLGEGHTRDNIIGYFPDEKVIFGGCLIKELGAGKGNLADANINDWPLTVAKLKETYPDIKTVIPGHGKTGGTELLDYTIKLFELKD